MPFHRPHRLSPHLDACYGGDDATHETREHCEAQEQVLGKRVGALHIKAWRKSQPRRQHRHPRTHDEADAGDDPGLGSPVAGGPGPAGVAVPAAQAQGRERESAAVPVSESRRNFQPIWVSQEGCFKTKVGRGLEKCWKPLFFFFCHVRLLMVATMSVSMCSPAPNFRGDEEGEEKEVRLLYLPVEDESATTCDGVLGDSSVEAVVGDPVRELCQVRKERDTVGPPYTMYYFLLLTDQFDRHNEDSPHYVHLINYVITQFFFKKSTI